MIDWNCVNFWVKDEKDKQCSFIFKAAYAHIIKGANISGGHCIYIYIYIYIFLCYIRKIIEKAVREASQQIDKIELE